MGVVKKKIRQILEAILKHSTILQKEEYVFINSFKEKHFHILEDPLHLNIR